MFVKNQSELRKALRQNERLIQVDEEKFKAKVINAAMKKGRLYDHTGQKILNKKGLVNAVVAGAIAETTMIMFGIIALIALLGLYATYREYDIKVIINEDGTVTFETQKDKT